MPEGGSKFVNSFRAETKSLDDPGDVFVGGAGVDDKFAKNGVVGGNNVDKNAGE